MVTKYLFKYKVFCSSDLIKWKRIALKLQIAFWFISYSTLALKWKPMLFFYILMLCCFFCCFSVNLVLRWWSCTSLPKTWHIFKKLNVILLLYGIHFVIIYKQRGADIFVVNIIKLLLGKLNIEWYVNYAPQLYF